MSNRHCFRLTNKDTGECKEWQILGNNDYFDDAFYENLNIEVDEDGVIEETVVDLTQFAVEWHNFLHRHSKILGLPQVVDNVEITGEYLLYFYGGSESYELQIFRVIREITDHLMETNSMLNPDKDYIFIIECY